MRKQDEDENAANHHNRSLTPRLKQFENDEMGTTRKGRSHLCFKAPTAFWTFGNLKIQTYSGVTLTH